MARDLGYNVVIERGHCDLSDAIHDCMVAKVEIPYLDVGCNSGWLLEDVPGGMGLDATEDLAQRARAKGLNVVWGWGERLPFVDGVFRCVVLSGILEECAVPNRILMEALRVGRRVIGINPRPDSPWGEGSRSRWVKSVMSPDQFVREWNAIVGPCGSTHWWFEICGS